MLRRNHDGLAPISLASRRVTGTGCRLWRSALVLCTLLREAAVAPNTFSNLVPVLWLA